MSTWCRERLNLCLHNFAREPVLPQRPHQMKWAPPITHPIMLNMDSAYFMSYHSDGVAVVANNVTDGSVLGGVLEEYIL